MDSHAASVVEECCSPYPCWRLCRNLATTCCRAITTFSSFLLNGCCLILAWRTVLLWASRPPRSTIVTTML